MKCLASFSGNFIGNSAVSCGRKRKFTNSSFLILGDIFSSLFSPRGTLVIRPCGIASSCVTQCRISLSAAAEEAGARAGMMRGWSFDPTTTTTTTTTTTDKTQQRQINRRRRKRREKPIEEKWIRRLSSVCIFRLFFGAARRSEGCKSFALISRSLFYRRLSMVYCHRRRRQKGERKTT